MPEENVNRESPVLRRLDLPLRNNIFAPAAQETSWLAWIAVLVLFGVAFYLVLHPQGRDRQSRRCRRTPPGRIWHGHHTPQLRPRKGNIGVYLDAIGTVTPVYTDVILAQASGPVTAVHYREGQMVRKGDPLIDIDPRPIRPRSQQAQGTLEKDTNVLAQATDGSGPLPGGMGEERHPEQPSTTRKRSCCRMRAR